jgi:protein SCO1
MRPLLVGIFLATLVAGCSRAKRYEIEGQVLAINTETRELTIRHKDIKGFMPGMTMPFRVADTVVLTERKPGELIKATLVVSDSLGIVENIVRIGEAPLPPDAPAPRATPILEVGSAAPDAQFVDQHARPRRLADWRGRVVAVTFVYTRCPLPDFCPLMDRNFAAVQRAFTQDTSLAGRFHLLSVSFDPEHDTPDVLATHARKAGADPATWTWLTGARNEVERFASAFGVSIIREDKTNREIVHNLRTIVIDRDGKIAKIFNGNEWKPEELLAALRAADGR